MTIVKIANGFRSSEDVERESTTSSDSAETEVSSSDSGSSDSEYDSATGQEEAEVELTQPGTDVCQVGDRSCILPDELYDLNDLSEILSVDTWNNCLSEEERFALSGFLPDLDRETFANTLSDLFAGKNFHFASPMSELFTQLKGGLCDPSIVLYKRGLKFLQKRKYYHNLQNYHNSFVGNLVEIRETWQNYKGYKIQERLKILNTVRSQKLLGFEENEERESEFESETDSEEPKYYSKRKEKEKPKFEKDVIKSTNNKGVILEPVKIKIGNYANKKANPDNQAVTVASYGYNLSKKGKYLEKSDHFNHYDKPIQALPIDRSDKSNPKNSQKSSNKILIKNTKLGQSRGKVLKQKDETESDSSDQQTKQETNNLPVKREYNEISEVISAKGKKKSKLMESTSNQEVQLVKRVYIPISSNNEKLLPVESYTLKRKQKPLNNPDPVNFTNNEGLLRKSEKNSVQVPSPLAGCTSTTKKSKGKNIINNKININNNFAQMDKHVIDSFDLKPDFSNSNSNPNPVSEETSFTKKKGKRKLDQVVSEPVFQNPVSENPVFENPVFETPVLPDPEPEPEKPVKKTYTLITPTIHTGFSFSIIHLLSAVRKAMISPLEDENISTSSNKDKFPALTVQEIVNRVKKNPIDPFILETQEPLQELVRGVLRIFSSKTAPLGAKGWRQLAAYERANKTYSWTGPVNQEPDITEEETSSDAWALPHKMLVKLVDSFANWLKAGQETLQQIGSLPAPPASILSNLDEKDRFKDLRAQKSLSTITPSSDEFKEYFRKEEFLRYSIPDRAFHYTAADGKKTIVPPLRRGGGKPTSKARDHFMLKPDRPPHVTILCLVRDAAARLPFSIGTRADVCTLLRDSQYIVDDVSDSQVNQVVSGALDRLHYERDPCVQFDGERKLWVYLHREREEEDFEDDGTSSTKKWKRPKKDGVDDGGAEFEEREERCQLAEEKVGTADSVGVGTVEVEVQAGGVGTSTGTGTDINMRVGTGTGTGTDTNTPARFGTGTTGVGTGTDTNTPVRFGTSMDTNTPVRFGTGTGTAGVGTGTDIASASKVSVGMSMARIGTGMGTVGSSVGTVRTSAARTGTGMVGTSGVKMVCHENSMNDDFDDEEYGGGERLFGAILL
ncbi:hypothetical protein LUZ60_003801 [Juncus effusus]|nr:hypothetical protein LUZ60_003801 [Juncus effusus]